MFVFLTSFLRRWVVWVFASALLSSPFFTSPSFALTDEEERIIQEEVSAKREEVFRLAGALQFPDGEYRVYDEYLNDIVFEGDLTKSYRKAVDDYRATIAAEAIYRTKDLTTNKEKADALIPLIVEAERYLVNIRQGIVGVYMHESREAFRRANVGPDAYQRRIAASQKVKKLNVARLKLAYHRLTTLQLMFADLAGPVTLTDYPELTRRKPESIQAGRTLNWATYYIAQLVDRLVVVSSEIPELGYDRDKQEYMYEQEREFLVTQVLELVYEGKIINLSTGVPFTKKQRRDVGDKIRENIADYMRVLPLRIQPDPQTLQKIAARIDTNANSVSYIMSQYTFGPNNPTPKEFFLAAKLALSEVSLRQADQFVNQYLLNEEEWWETGLGNVLRANDMNGVFAVDSSITSVRERIETFRVEAENLSVLFQQAYETDDPADLNSSTRDALIDFGVVVKYRNKETGKLQYQYHVVNAAHGIGDFIDKKAIKVDIPGKSVFDVVNPKNVAITIASTQIPGLGARWLGAGLEAAGTSRAGVMVGKFLLESTLSAGISVADQALTSYLKEDDFTLDFEKLLIETYGLGAIQKVAGDFSSHILEDFVRQASRSVNHQATRTFLKKALQEDPSKAREIFEFVNNVTGVAVDTSVGFALQPMIDGEPLDIAALQSMLLQSALAQALDTTSGSLRAQLEAKRAPKSLIDAIEADPKMSEEIKTAIRKRKDVETRMRQRFEASVSEQGFSASSHFDNMLTGEFGWDATKALLTSKNISDAQMEKVGKHRWDLINKNERDGRYIAIQDINHRFEDFYNHELSKGHDPETARKEAMARVQYEINLISQDTTIPGARTKISDVDRSSASVFLRRAMVEVAETNARLRTGEPVVTTGQSIDANEYYGSLPLIKESAKFQEAMNRLNHPSIGEELGLPAGINHENAMDAIGMSMAVRGASEDQAKVYFEARLREIVVDVQNGRIPQSEVSLFHLKREWALTHLKNTRQELKGLAQMHMDKHGVDAKTAASRAQEDLYHKRLLKISNDGWELHRLLETAGQQPENHAKALEVRARLMRRLQIANRDGINTYSSPATIDILISKVQSEVEITQPDGTVVKKKFSEDERMEDPNFTIDKDLNMYTLKNIESAIADQEMYVMKYINYYRNGKMNEVDLGRAIGKYMKRVYLFDAIKGSQGRNNKIADIMALPEKHPKRQLLEHVRVLVKNKGDLAKLGEELAKIDRRAPKSQAGGLAELFYLMEKSYPRFRGMTGVVTDGPQAKPLDLKVFTPESILTGAAGVLVDMIVSEQRKKKDLREAAGEASLVQLIKDNITENEQEADYLQVQKEEIQALAKKHLTRNWKEIRRFGRLRDFWEGIQEALIWPQGILSGRSSNPDEWPRSAARDVRDKAIKYHQEYEKWRNTELPGDVHASLMSDPLAQDYQRLHARIVSLQEEKGKLQKELEEAQERLLFQEPFIGLDMSGSWECQAVGQPVGTLYVTHNTADERNSFTAKLFQNDLEDDEPYLKFSGIYRFGRLLGTWHAPSIEVTPALDNLPTLTAARPFEAQVDKQNKHLRFPNSPMHDQIAIDWSNLSCMRTEEFATANEPYFSLQQASLPADMADQSDDPSFGALAVRILSPTGIETEGSAQVYRGQVPMGGPWYREGNYLVRTGLHKQSVRERVTLQGGILNKVILKPGAIQLTERSPQGSVRTYYNVYDVDNPMEPVSSGTYGEDGVILLEPGTYNVQLEAVGFIRRHAITIGTGDLIPVEVSWGNLVLQAEDGKKLYIKSLRQGAMVGNESGKALNLSIDMLDPENRKEFLVPPGELVVEVDVEGVTIKKRIIVNDRQDTIVTF